MRRGWSAYAAARTGETSDEIVEDAVRARFDADRVLDDVWARIGESDLTEQESLDLAYSELRAMRVEDANHTGAAAS